MKLSLDWLSDFIDFTEKDPHKIAEILTLGVAEVEQVEMQGALLDKCCVGKVLSVEKHPGADKLMLCEIETDKGKKRAVCGGMNLREGMLVAFAHCGARVKWHGEEMMELKKTKIRGEESEGMICAAEELELSTQFPNATGKNIIDMGDSGYEVGASLKEALGLGDVVLHVDNHSITHRADLFSHIGFARECVALELGKWKKDPTEKAPAFTKDPVPFELKVEAPELMPRYCSCLIEVDGTGETPDWMKKRLIAVGWRPLSLPVDITNYVATEVGVPLHSFDADDLKGEVHMRKAKKGEKIITLDEKEHELQEGALVLSDDEGIFDMLGIMGGLRSSTKTSTRRIYLHSCSLDPVSIRDTVLATGNRTDAATVYEKGVPPVTTEQGFYRAANLLLELAPGARTVSSMDSKGENGNPDPIPLSLSRTSSVLGREIAEKEAKDALTALDFDVQGSGNDFSVTPPLHRLNDIRVPVDLMEEIARISGYASFEEELPEAHVIPPERDHREQHMRRVLKEVGSTELLQFSFLGEELLEKSGLSTKHLQEIENPLGEDIKNMRPSLLPRLLEFATDNMRFVDQTLSAFEVGHVFTDKDEWQSLGLIVAAKRNAGIASEPFLIAKAALKEAAYAVNIDLTFKREKKSSNEKHPGRSTEVFVGKKKVGMLHEIHPTVSRRFDLPARAAFAELNLDLLFSEPEPNRICVSTSEFPAIVYDKTVSLGANVEVGSILEKAKQTSDLLTDIHLTDLFQKGDERNITFRCTYNAPDRTLTEEEVKPIHEKVEAALHG